MFQQDYMLRMINDLVRFLAKILLNKDTVIYKLPNEENYTKTDYLHKDLFDLIERGKINEAENLLFEEIKPKDKKYMELVLDFYTRLNDLNDEFLEKSNFSRKEIEEGLKAVAKEFGLSIYE